MPAKAAYSALPGLFLWRCVLVRSCFFTRDTSCDTKMWKGAAPKVVPSKLPNSPETQNTTLERMAFCVTKGDLTVLGMLSISHSDLHRNRKTVPMLWQESAIGDLGQIKNDEVYKNIELLLTKYDMRTYRLG